MAVVADMRKCFPVVLVGIAALTFGLAGCETDSYSEAVRYGFRNDPVVMPGAKLGDETDTPDRPGQLPLYKVGDLDNPHHPMHGKRGEIIEKEMLRDPAAIPGDKRAAMEKILEELFGTPAHPHVKGYDVDAQKVIDLDPEVVKTLKLDQETLAHGSKHYRQHCVHCHGVPGDGRGPTARWVNPHPRDFRQGLFKFQSVDQASNPSKSKRPPSRADLLRTLKQGIEGSAMPSFALLPAHELEALASYVIHLSLRGKAEFSTIVTAFENDKGSLKSTGEYPDPAVFLGSIHALNLIDWVESQSPDATIKVAEYPYKDGDVEALRESVQRGKLLFIGDPSLKEAKAANCVSCHNNYGRQSLYRWDEWGTLAKPANFTQGVFRGGRRPVDIYNRIHSGINGSGMTSFGNVLPPERIWDLVNFVQNISYKAMRDRLQVQID